MDTYFLIWFFIVGCVFGSFFGVVGGRLPEGKSIVKPRSHCHYCKHKLKWYELIPVISYIIQKGKCRSCKRSISIFYPVVELVTGVLFSLSFFCFGFSPELAISIIISSYFSIVLVSDVTYMIIPDSITVVFSCLAILIKLFSYGFNEIFNSILSGVIMFVITYAIMLAGNKIFKKESLGGADIKLMFFVGIVLSPALGMLNIFIASCIALPISLYFLIKNKDNIIPYGPFLLLACYLIYSFGIDYSFLQII